MIDRKLTFSKLEGYSGIRLKNNTPLVFEPGINLLVGRNGSGKTNLLRLIQMIANARGDLRGRIETTLLTSHSEAILKKKGKNLQSRLGKFLIVEHCLNGRSGSITIKLNKITGDHVLKNLINDPAGFQNHFDTLIDSESVKNQFISPNGQPPKFEMSGHLMSSNPLSREHDNRLHAMVSEPIRDVSDFIKDRLLEFYTSEEFTSRMKGLENSINDKFSRFLGTTNKQVRIDYHNIESTGRVSLSLLDNGNYIQSADLSTGETFLFNLVFSLTLAQEEKCNILILDEPDIHMHDDMIQVLVDELKNLSRALPDCLIILASHSTPLIEKLAALGERVVNIISFDNARRVANSKKDLELINALHRNGVTFSPLMLTRKLNIFIENKFQPADSNLELFSNFFDYDHKPNIIPIGTSGNVQDSEAFTGAIQSILKVSYVKSIGIQDGDIWIKPKLVSFLKAELTHRDFVKYLTDQTGCYIKREEPNSYYFNFWEIENLYLMPEILFCWQDKKGKPLTGTFYLELLRNNLKILSHEYLDTFVKSITRIKTEKNHSLSKKRLVVTKKIQQIESLLEDEDLLTQRATELAETILNQNLLHWVPGKEVTNLLKAKGYAFKVDDESIYKTSKLSEQIRGIFNIPRFKAD